MGFQLQELGAYQGETASPEGVEGSRWEGEGMVVSVDGEVQWVVACLLEVGWVACLGQRVDVQMGVAVGVPSSSQKVVVAA